MWNKKKIGRSCDRAAIDERNQLIVADCERARHFVLPPIGWHGTRKQQRDFARDFDQLMAWANMRDSANFSFLFFTDLRRSFRPRRRRSGSLALLPTLRTCNGPIMSSRKNNKRKSQYETKKEYFWKRKCLALDANVVEDHLVLIRRRHLLEKTKWKWNFKYWRVSLLRSLGRLRLGKTATADCPLVGRGKTLFLLQ